MRITINDIARISNVSRTTVSRVLNNKSDVRSETRDKVEKIIKQYDFHPSVLAKGNITKKCNTIGVVIPYSSDYILSNLFYSEVLRGMANEAEKQKYYLMICNNSNSKDYISTYKEKRVDGFIIVSPNANDGEYFKLLDEHRIPYIATSKTPLPNSKKYIDIDNACGASLAVEHLASLGHKRIAFINVPDFLMSHKDRLLGYKLGLEKHGIEFCSEYIKIGDTTIKSGYDLAKQLLKLRDRPTAILAGNDMMAIGVIKLIRSLNYNIPGDFSVVGFDDIPLAEELDPPLTTIRQPAYKKGIEACKILIDFIEKGNPIKEKILPIKLIIRGSTSEVRYDCK